MSNFSTAINLRGDASSGVDPRTGSFYYSFPIISIKPLKELYPDVDLNISFSQGSLTDDGFGRGWRLSITSYNPKDHSITLRPGNTYKVINQLSRLTLENYKCKDISIINGKDDILILYKSGDIEKIDKLTGKLKSINEIKFNWDEAGRLKSIINGDRNEINIYYQSNSLVTIESISYGDVKLYVQFYLDFILDSKIGCLNRIVYGKYLVKNIKFKYELFDNKPDSILAIGQVVNNYGKTEVIVYKQDGFKVPDNFPLSKPLPYVIKYIRKGDAEQEKVVYFKYSESNYLGYNSKISWKEGVDILNEVGDDYFYYCVITLSDKEIKTVYSKFHLMTSEVLYDKGGAERLKKEMVYFCNPKENISSQPYNYTLIKSISELYVNDGKVKKYTESFEYDDYANLITHIGKDNVRTENDYYSNKGEGELCPADPYGMVRYLKITSVYPKNNHDCRDSVYYSYSKIDSTDFIVLKSERNKLQYLTYDYYIDSDFIGFLKEIWTVAHSPEGVSKSTYSYIRNKGILSIKQDVESAGLTYSVYTKIDESINQVISEINMDGVEDIYEYNVDNLINKAISANGTVYEKTINYSISYEQGRGVVITKVDNRGLVTKQYLTGSLLPYLITKSTDGVNFTKTKELTYNDLDQLINESDFDSINNIEISSEKFFTYDIFGNVETVRSYNGDIETALIDHIENTKTISINGDASITIEYYDEFNLLIKKECYYSGVIRFKEFFTYDDYRNLTSVISDKGLKIITEYDIYHRKTKSSYYLSGNHSHDVSFSYLDFAYPDKESSMYVDNLMVGSTRYDSLGRVSSLYSAGRLIEYEYGQHSMPIKQKINDEHICTYINLVEIHKISSTHYAGRKDLDCYYKYNYSSDDLSSAINNNQKVVYKKDAFGRVVTEIVDGLEKNYKYSIGGLVISEVEPSGISKIYGYNEKGLVNAIIAYDINKKFTCDISIFYDEKFNLTQADITSSNQEKHSVIIKYDDLRREIHRTISNGSEKNTIDTTYSDAYNKIDSRVFKYSGFYIREQYHYDPLRRVSIFSMDTNDRNMYSSNLITYKYTGFDGLKERVYTFSDGTSNIETYHYNDVRLMRITNTHPEFPTESILNYDPYGNLIKDNLGNNYAFNKTGQLEGFLSITGEYSKYRYNSFGELVEQEYSSGERNRYYYSNSFLIKEECSGVSVNYTNLADVFCIKSFFESGELSRTDYAFFDNTGSTVVEYAFEKYRISKKITHFSPFGVENEHLFSIK